MQKHRPKSVGKRNTNKQDTLLEVFNPTGTRWYQGDLSDTKSTEWDLKRHKVDFRSVSSTKLTQR